MPLISEDYIVRVKEPVSNIDRAIQGIIKFSSIGDRLKPESSLSGLPSPWTNSINGQVVTESTLSYIGEESLESKNTIADSVIANLQLMIEEKYGVRLTLEYVSSQDSDAETNINDGISNNVITPPNQISDTPPVNQLVFNVEYEDIFSNIEIGELFIIGKEDNFIYDEETLQYFEDEFTGSEELPIKVDYEPDGSIDVPVVIENSAELEEPFTITQPKDGSMTISSRGIKQLMKHEGSRSTVYDDKTGKSITSYNNCIGYPTIGVGHLITNSEKSTFAKFLSPGSMSTNAIENLLLKDLQVRIKDLNRKLRVKVSQNQFDALLSMMFNCGAANKFYKKALEQTNQGDFKGAAATIKSGPKTSKRRILAGLERRREDESNLYLA